MTKNELNRFRAILSVRVAELESFTRHREGLTVERSADQLEEIQAASQRALAVSNLDFELANFETHVLRFVASEEGSFGICQECDQDIHPKRLAAVPWAPYCIRCQEAMDSNLRELQAPSGDCFGRAA